MTNRSTRRREQQQREKEAKEAKRQQERENQQQKALKAIDITIVIHEPETKDSLTEKFLSAHRRAEQLQGTEPTDDMKVTEKDLEKYHTTKFDWDKLNQESLLFSFSCRPYRPSAVVAHVDSPWLEKHLKPITFDQMKVDKHHRGTSIRLKNLSQYTRFEFGTYYCAVEDKKRAKGWLACYNVFDTFGELAHFQGFIVKEPYYTLNYDGKLVVRVDHPSDLIITQPYSRGPRGPYPNKNDQERRLRRARELIEGGELAVKIRQLKVAKCAFKDCEWVAAETAETEEPLPALHQCYHYARCRRLLDVSLLERGWSDNVYLQIMDSIRSGVKVDQKEKSRLLRLAIQSALDRQDPVTAVKHYNEFVEAGGLEVEDMFYEHNLLSDLEEILLETGSGDYDGQFVNTRSGRFHDLGVYPASYLKNVKAINNICLKATCKINKGGLILAERAFEVVYEEELYAEAKIRNGKMEYEQFYADAKFQKGKKEDIRVECLNEGGPRILSGIETELSSSVLDKCMRLFVTTREWTDLFDEIPRDCRRQEPYDIFHIQDVVCKHAIKWRTNPDEAKAGSFESVGIWPTSSHARGSDNPNAMGLLVNYMLFLLASRDIEEGEIITMREIQCHAQSDDPHIIPYKKDENYQGGDPEPFLPAREDAPPDSLIDPGAWLFDPDDKEVPRPETPPSEEVLSSERNDPPPPYDADEGKREPESREEHAPEDQESASHGSDTSETTPLETPTGEESTEPNSGAEEEEEEDAENDSLKAELLPNRNEAAETKMILAKVSYSNVAQRVNDENTQRLTNLKLLESGKSHIALTEYAAERATSNSTTLPSVYTLDMVREMITQRKLNEDLTTLFAKPIKTKEDIQRLGEIASGLRAAAWLDEDTKLAVKHSNEMIKEAVRELVEANHS